MIDLYRLFTNIQHFSESSSRNLRSKYPGSIDNSQMDPGYLLRKFRDDGFVLIRHIEQLLRKKRVIPRIVKTVSLSLLLPLLLAGCSVLKPVELPQIHTYTLDPDSVAITKKPTTNLSLLVQQPVMNSGFDTQRMAYMTRNFDIGYFSENQWTGNPGQLLAPLVAQTLALSGHYQSVVMPPYAGFVDRELDLNILSFYQDFRTQPSQIHLRVVAQLIDRRTGRVLKSHDFEVNQATTSDTPYGGVIAANKAVAKFLTQLSQFA